MLGQWPFIEIVVKGCKTKKKYIKILLHVLSENKPHSFMPPPCSGEGHVVLPLSVRTSVTPFSTVLVSATPLKVFDAGT